MLNTRHLKVFQTVCKEMNMTKASNELFISQPAISKTISEIEEYYHVKLFERRNKSLILLPDGQRLYEYACAVLDLIEKMDRTMKEDGRMEVVRVGASITTGTSILSDISVAYHQANPRVKLIATVDNTDVIERDLLDSKLDIAIVEGEISSRYIETEPLGDTEVVLVVNRMHPLYEKENVTLEDLQNMDFIVREQGSKTRARFSVEMEKAGVRWNPAWSCHNTQTIQKRGGCGTGNRRFVEIVSAETATERPVPGAECFSGAADAPPEHRVSKEPVYAQHPGGLQSIYDPAVSDHGPGRIL